MDKGKVPVRIRLEYFLRFYSIQTANACIVDMSKSQKSSYDAFHYPSLPFSQTHPNRLATMGVLVGMCPPDVRNCRVLEIGCGTGGNIIPMAEQIPGSRLLGIDLSERQVREAQEWISQLGLTNVEVQKLDILHADHELGEFDYILCHGVFSWVPAGAQRAILDLCSKHLCSNGIAYISYNTNPGWNIRGMVRDIVCFHTKGIEDPKQKIDQGKQLLGFLANSLSPKDPYGMLIKKELDTFVNKDDAYVYHDYFEDTNLPVYFHEFVEALSSNNLQYLCEADTESMYRGDLPKNVIQTLERISANEIQVEQYLDYLRKRTFRQSLISHANNKVHLILQPAMVDRFFLESFLLPSMPAAMGSVVHFRNRLNGATLTIEDPLLRTAFLVLSELTRTDWQLESLHDEISFRLRGQIPNSEENSILEKQVLRNALLQAFVAGHLAFHTVPPRYTYDLSGKPCASRCSRSQAMLGSTVTSLTHHNVVLSNLERTVLQLLDGNTELDELSSKVQYPVDNQAATTALNAKSLKEVMSSTVENLARRRLLLKT